MIMELTDRDRPLAGPWTPAFDLVGVASRKIAAFEQSFAQLQDAADRRAREDADEKRRLMDRIEELSVLLHDSHANYERTLGLLEASSRICAQQCVELRQMSQTLAEAKDNTAEMTALIRHLHGIMADTLPLG